MKGLKLPVYFHTDHTAQFEDLDIAVDISEFDTREITFYQIDVVIPRKDNDTTIVVGGESFICKMHATEVDAKIEEHMIYNPNF